MVYLQNDLIFQKYFLIVKNWLELGESYIVTNYLISNH